MFMRDEVTERSESHQDDPGNNMQTKYQMNHEEFILILSQLAQQMHKILGPLSDFTKI